MLVGQRLRMRLQVAAHPVLTTERRLWSLCRSRSACGAPLVNALPRRMNEVRSARSLVLAGGVDMYASGDINRRASDADIYRGLVEASTDIIVRTGLDGVLTYVSPACRALGYEPG